MIIYDFWGDFLEGKSLDGMLSFLKASEGKRKLRGPMVLKMRPWAEMKNSCEFNACNATSRTPLLKTSNHSMLPCILAMFSSTALDQIIRELVF